MFMGMGGMGMGGSSMGMGGLNEEVQALSEEEVAKEAAAAALYQERRVKVYILHTLNAIYCYILYILSKCPNPTLYTAY
jgi:hypothetical protein